MKKRLYEKWWVWLTVTAAFLLIIHILFHLIAPFNWLEAVWDAGDIITFAGTMVLGFVAVSQTAKANDQAEEANKLSERLMEIENNHYLLELRPFVMVTEWKGCNLTKDEVLFHPQKLSLAIGKYSDGNAVGLSLFFFNTTESVVTLEFAEAKSEKLEFSISYANQHKRKLIIPPCESQEMVFYADEEFMSSLEGQRFEMSVYLENRIAQRYKESFELIIMGFTDRYSVLKDDEWYCDVTAQNYRIGKFVPGEDGKPVLVMEDQFNG